MERYTDEYFMSEALKEARKAFEIGEQRVGCGVVGLCRLAVETARVGMIGGEQTAVEHQVAANFAHAFRAQAAQQRPQIFNGELGIAATFQNQVASKHIVFQDALDFPLRRT